MRRPFLFKIASTNGLAALPALTPGALAAGQRAISPMPVSKGARSHRSAVRPRLSHKHADQRKRAGGNQTKGTDDEKSQEDRDFLFAGLRRHQRSRCALSIKTCNGPPLRSQLK